MISSELAFKLSTVLLCGSAIFLVFFSFIRDPQSLPYRYWSKYTVFLERQLRNMFILTSGALIARGQVAVLALAVGLTLYLEQPLLYLSIPLILFGPVLYIENKRKSRLRAIEAKMDSFILTLANALKSTPSIGNALAYAQPLIAPPLDEEIGLALKEIRVGNTIDQALLNMAGRIQSVQLDATLSGILIGRQVGGDLTRILETTAGTLREISRLQGVIKAKTAEGKAQVTVLAFFPVAILLLFDLVSPGYFDPLTENIIGWLLIGASVALWAGSLLLARKVLAVDI